MKKTLIGIVIILLLGLIYYFTFGSSKIIEVMKNRVNHEIHTLKDHGFTIEDYHTEQDQEHFVITVDDPNEIHTYLHAKNIQLNPENIKRLKDQKIGVDIKYLPRATDALAIEIYPINLPSSFYQSSEPKDKEMIQTIEKMLNEKVFLVHININKLGTGFDGYIKDINEAFVLDGNESSLTTKSWTFKGQLDNKAITQASQELQAFTYRTNDILSFNLKNFTSTLYNNGNRGHTVDYSLNSMELLSDNNNTFRLSLEDIQGHSKDLLEGSLLNSKSQLNIDTITLVNNDERMRVDQTILNASVDNLNLKAIKKLKTFTNNNEGEQTVEKLMPLLQSMTDANTSLHLDRLSVTSISENNETFKGFDINGKLEVNKGFDWNNLDHNPMQLMQLFDMKANLILSNEIVDMVAENPRALMVMMFLQPKEQNGSKIYDIEYSNGSLSVNGAPLLQ